jgi:phthalate 4,5-cis-dihydrodiol dehydrogenase
VSGSNDRPKLQLGIAGLGLAGAMMIRAAVVHPRVALVAGADPLPRPREAFARDIGGRTYETFEALCVDPEVEAVYIASPHEHHVDQAIRALALGKHVLCEKPMALTLADCDRLIAAADASPFHLIVGHTHGFDPNVRFVRDLVSSGEMGRLGMILSFNYTDFLYRPRRPEELVTERGGGITFNQVMHQVETVRAIASGTTGGRVRSVRANVSILDPARPSEGNCTAFLEFESGAAATLVYSGYDFFDSDELHGWVAEGGNPKPPPSHGALRRRLLGAPSDEPAWQRDLGFGGRKLPVEQPHLPHFGVLIATCEKGDIRFTPDGVIVYGVDGPRAIKIERGVGRPGHGDALEALWAAVRDGRRDPHDARWGKASVEIILAILRSGREQREIVLEHQVG